MKKRRNEEVKKRRKDSKFGRQADRTDGRTPHRLGSCNPSLARGLESSSGREALWLEWLPSQGTYR